MSWESTWSGSENVIHDYTACVNKEPDLLMGERTFPYLYAYESFAPTMSKTHWEVEGGSSN